MRDSCERAKRTRQQPDRRHGTARRSTATRLERDKIAVADRLGKAIEVGEGRAIPPQAQSVEVPEACALQRTARPSDSTGAAWRPLSGDPIRSANAEPHGSEGAP
jgi:hypothetical protein